jgi:pyridoxal phosphate enzyme (YggS family)
MHSLGVTDFGESYDQEAAAKTAALAAMDCRPRWHFVGRLQRNKCASIAHYADVVHAVDRAALVDALAAGATRAGRVVDVLLQVSLDGDASRGGAAPRDVRPLADRVAASSGLALRGVMAVAPLAADADAAFAALAATAAELRSGHPDAVVISAGMSGDLEAAVAHGATCVRVGTALFGHRAQGLR